MASRKRRIDLTRKIRSARTLTSYEVKLVKGTARRVGGA